MKLFACVVFFDRLFKGYGSFSTEFENIHVVKSNIRDSS
jgi:hypothetical protein